MELERSPLALPFPEDLPEIEGVTLRVARARYKDWDRADLTYVELCEDTSVAGVFTQSACASSEVELGREQVRSGTARAVSGHGRWRFWWLKPSRSSASR